jgi:hypothetical protein
MFEVFGVMGAEGDLRGGEGGRVVDVLDSDVGWVGG